MANQCLQCNNQISVKAKYCSDKCRMAYIRSQPEQPEQNKAPQPEQIQPEQTKQPEQTTPNNQPEQVWTEQGKCHACGIEVSDLICICHKCTAKGITHKQLGLDIAKCDY